MADEVEVEKPKGREAGETAAALDKVTDFSEEKEMRANVDNSKVQQAMQALAAEQAQRNEAQRQRERELAAVKVSKAVCSRPKSVSWLATGDWPKQVLCRPCQRATQCSSHMFALRLC